ncbi:hypothetical protein HK407_03g05980 [Ordospora pajunii]|uniref:uncharacterized protein n=1 Tax=Ordospora pajunii TaxID=3039483 RepID=UPI0029529191|nr:uncharacterized protein HK407_03g05980 [Ordospora pajunii]KAH9411846.1 hypothetical protein HK407_03g05980 [Ordospora pajunii]
MKAEQLHSMNRRRKEFHEFILSDTKYTEQRSCLMSLRVLNQSYRQAGLSSNEMPDPSTKVISKLSRGNTVLGYKLHLIRLALIDGRPFKPSIEVKRHYYNQASIVLLLAMIKNKPELVYSMLSGGFPSSINASIFGSALFPTYFHLACAMSSEILSVFMSFSPNYELCWNGLTPQMIASFGGKTLDAKQTFNFVTMRQYGLLNAYRGIETVKTADKPLFLVDFLCMSDDIAAAKKILDRNPELAKASRLCYLVQANMEFVFLLSKYQTSICQEINGMSALHAKSADGDIEQLIAFLALGCNVNATDCLGNTAMHYSASHEHFDCLEILIRLGGNRSMVNRDGISTDDILAAKNMTLDIKDVDVELPEAIFQLLEHSENLWHYLSIVRRIRYNRSHTIVKKNRFTITSLLNLPHKIDYTEAMIHKISQVKQIDVEAHSPSKTLQLFMEYVQN